MKHVVHLTDKDIADRLTKSMLDEGLRPISIKFKVETQEQSDIFDRDRWTESVFAGVEIEVEKVKSASSDSDYYK